MKHKVKKTIIRTIVLLAGLGAVYYLCFFQRTISQELLFAKGPIKPPPPIAVDGANLKYSVVGLGIGFSDIRIDMPGARGAATITRKIGIADGRISSIDIPFPEGYRISGRFTRGVEFEMQIIFKPSVGTFFVKILEKPQWTEHGINTYSNFFQDSPVLWYNPNKFLQSNKFRFRIQHFNQGNDRNNLWGKYIREPNPSDLGRRVEAKR